MTSRLRVELILLLVGVMVMGGCRKPQPQTAQPPSARARTAAQPFAPDDPALIAANNRGVGLMGMFKYEEARIVFAELAQGHPNWVDVQVNLAIATLNRQHEGDEAAALKILDAALALESNHLRAHYCSGLLRLYLESPEVALRHFQLVAAADPDDAYAAYYIGQCLAQTRQYDKAIEWFTKALELDPYLRSGYYAASQSCRALRRDDEARSLLEDFQKLEKNPRAKLVEFKYTRMGPKGQVQAVDVAKPQAIAHTAPQGPVFLDPVPLLEDGEQYTWKKRDAGEVGGRPVSITACDIDMDGDIDIFIADALDHDDLHNAVCVNDGAGKFTLDADHILATIPDVNAALWGDHDNDGLTDAYLCRRGPNMLWRNSPALEGGGEGAGENPPRSSASDDSAPPTHPLSPSLPGRGEWRDVTVATGTANGQFDTVDGAMADFDHDGDLDIFCVNADGPNELLNNNLDGTFLPIAQERGIDGSKVRAFALAGQTGRRAAQQVLPLDLDGDRDLDIFVRSNQPPHELHINDRLWNYSEAPTAGFLRDNPKLLALAHGDHDADGQTDLFAVFKGSVSGSGTVQLEGAEPQDVTFEFTALWATRYSMEKDGKWTTQRNSQFAGIWPASMDHLPLLLGDFDGDGSTQALAVAINKGGELELVFETAIGAETRPADPSQPVKAASSYEPAPGAATIWPDGGNGASVVALARTGAPMMFRAGPGRRPFASLAFTGRTDPGSGPPPMRSNASGIGTHFAARIDSMWVAGSTLRNSSGPGQSLQPVAIGLGGHEKIDFIAIDWSDGVFQSEIDLRAGELHTIVEQQRQLSSCPVLFAWNGTKYEFVTDLLGVGGIGYLLSGAGRETAGDGGSSRDEAVYAPSRPWERLLLPANLLQPKDGRYVLKLGEPMEEACYLDSARLVAYDLPPGWAMAVDDRMSILGPEPTGEARFYRTEILPQRAINDRGEDVTADLMAADLRAAPVGELDRRFIGRLKGDHVITMTFSREIGGGPSGEPLMVIDGWVEYPYSQTMFAAWQAKADYRPPTIEARDQDGQWHIVLEQFGYPAGMPRQMSVPLPLEKLPAGAKELRITTNQEIYLDRIAIAFAESDAASEVARRELPLAASRLARCGFAQRLTGPQRQPHYDYGRRTPFWDTRHQAGFYTAFGAVDELIAATDDAVAIFGPGEEVHMEFASDDLPTLPPGWSRRFVLEADGWCKDMDLFTKDGETVGPLPRAGPDSSRPDELHQQFNTRYESGR